MLMNNIASSQEKHTHLYVYSIQSRHGLYQCGVEYAWKSQGYSRLFAEALGTPDCSRLSTITHYKPLFLLYSFNFFS